VAFKSVIARLLLSTACFLADIAERAFTGPSMAGGVCLIGFGTVLTAWRERRRTGLQCGEETARWKKGRRGEEAEEETMRCCRENQRPMRNR